MFLFTLCQLLFVAFQTCLLPTRKLQSEPLVTNWATSVLTSCLDCVVLISCLPVVFSFVLCYKCWYSYHQIANISQLFWPTDTSVRLYSLLSTGVSDDDIFMYTNLQINTSAAYCIQSRQNAICLLIRCLILWNTVGKELSAKLPLLSYQIASLACAVILPGFVLQNEFQVLVNR